MLFYKYTHFGDIYILYRLIQCKLRKCASKTVNRHFPRLLTHDYVYISVFSQCFICK